jgi:hypothetical protein
MEHWFWLSLSIISIGWYLFITAFVAVKGYFDIRNMLRRLKANDTK